MRPKLLKQVRRSTFKRTKSSRERDKRSAIWTESEESEDETEELLQKENESDGLRNDYFQEFNNRSSRESKTLLNQEIPEQNRRIFQSVPKEKVCLIGNKIERKAELNEPPYNELSADDRLFVTDDDGTHVASALPGTKDNKFRRLRQERYTTESIEITSDDHTKRDPFADVSVNRNVFKTEHIHDSTKTTRHRTAQSAHAYSKGKSKLNSNLFEQSMCSSKNKISRSQSESLPYAVDIGEIEKLGDERRRNYAEEAHKARNAKLSSTDTKNQAAEEIYKTLVRSKRNRLSFTELTDILLTKKCFYSVCENESDLVALFEMNDDKFVIDYNAMDEPSFSVKTKIAICSIFTNDPKQKHTCHDLHVCKYFLLSQCSLGKCKFGHNLSTKHNRTVFGLFTLDGVDMDSKKRLIRSIDSRNISTLPLVCKFYNNQGGCKHGKKCTHLHLCKNYINGDCKFGKKCIRCHNILTKQHLSLLKRYGLDPTNRYNFEKILGVLKDTLDDGGVLLKRDYQHGKVVKGDRTNSFSSMNDRHDYSTSGTLSSERSDTNGESEGETEDDWTEQTLDENGREEQVSSSEYDEDEYEQTAESGCSSLYKHIRDKEYQEQKTTDGYQTQSNTHKHDLLTNKGPKGDTNLIMTFESKIEEKHFMIRKVNGQLEITNNSRNWHIMNARESSRLYQLHNEFVTLFENSVSQQ